MQGMRSAAARYVPLAVLVVLVVALQLLLSAVKQEYYLTQLTMAAYYTLVALGLCLLMGYAGQISLGHAGFFAIGGYTSAVLTTASLGTAGAVGAAGLGAAFLRLGILVPRTDAFGTPILSLLPWAAFLAALAVTAVVAVVIGIPVLRLRGHYLAMATLAFGVIVARVAVGTRVFGEADGISDVPAFRLLLDLAVSGRKALRVQNYYIAWALVAAGLLLVINLVGSRAGRALRAIHGNEEAAAAMGVNVARYKLAVFVLSALYAAVGGACLVHFNGGIGPGEAGVMKSVRYVALVAAGGMGNAGGVLAVSAILTFLSLRGVFGQLDDAVFGAILVAIMLFAPEGLFAPLGAQLRRLLGRRAALRRAARAGAPGERRERGAALRARPAPLVRWPARDRRGRVRLQAGHHQGPDRPQRRGKVDAAEPRLGRPAACLGEHHLQRQPHDRDPSAPGSRPGDLAHIPDHAPVPRHDRPGKPDGGQARARPPGLCRRPAWPRRHRGRGQENAGALPGGARPAGNRGPRRP